MAVVKEYMIGNTHVRIHDDACVRTTGEMDEILRRVADIVLSSYATVAAKGEKPQDVPDDVKLRRKQITEIIPSNKKCVGS